MAYIDLYGRNPDTLATAFDYPRSVIPMAKAPPLYLTLPAAASRIFGRTNLRMHEADDNTVALDPRSTYERTERWRGLGGLGVDKPTPTPQTAPVRTVISEVAEYADKNKVFLGFVTAGMFLTLLMAMGTFKKVFT